MTTTKDEKKRSSKKMTFFRCRVVDWVLNLFVFFPSMLCYWRGIWDLYSYYFSMLSEDKATYNWYIFGASSSFLAAYFVYPLVNRLIARFPVVIRGAMVRLVLYLGGIFSMGYVRGVWGLLDHYLQPNWQSGVIGLAISFPSLILLNASRSVIFPPFVVAMDSRMDALVPSTRFQSRLTPGLRNIVVYSMDSLFTHFVIRTLMILAWHSTLALIGMLPVADDQRDFVCFGVGIFAVVLFFALEIPLIMIGRRIASGYRLNDRSVSGSPAGIDPTTAQNRDLASTNTAASGTIFSSGIGAMCRRLCAPKARAGMVLRAYENLVFLFVFGGEAFLWLGAWNLNATYLIADKRLGGWVNHVFGSFLLITLGLMTFGGFCGCGSDESVLASLLDSFWTSTSSSSSSSSSNFSSTSVHSLYLYPNRYVRAIMEESVLQSESSGGGTSSNMEASVAMIRSDVTPARATTTVEDSHVSVDL